MFDGRTVRFSRAPGSVWAQRSLAARVTNRHAATTDAVSALGTINRTEETLMLAALAHRIVRYRRLATGTWPALTLCGGFAASTGGTR